MNTKPVYLTAEGLTKLKAELNELEAVGTIAASAAANHAMQSVTPMLSNAPPT